MYPSTKDYSDSVITREIINNGKALKAEYKVEKLKSDAEKKYRDSSKERIIKE